ncbi:MAG: EAL domain-containing protein, partial [Casimicrobiaceae bacterium]
DQFRQVASTSGIDALETLAGALAGAFVAAAPRDAIIAVFREDTFALLLQDYSADASRRTVEEILSAVSDYPFEHEQHVYRIGVYVGMGTFKVGEVSSVEMIRRTDAACIAAKSSGRNTLRVYEPTAADLKQEEAFLDWAGRIDSVLASEELHLRCQLVAPIAAGNPLKPYYELLLGIEAIGGQRVSPFEFVTAMERLGRAHEIDLWVLRQAFDWIRENQSVFTEVAGLAVNLSASSLGRREITDYIRDAFAHGSVSARHLIFEITESAAIRNFDTAQAFIRELRRFGARVSLDDFGSGFTSYAHLKRLSAHTLKIDGSYVKDMLTSDSDLAIVKSMTDIAHTLGMTVVAEWVETPEILARLIELGVDYAQGYAVHRPVRLSHLLSAPPG